MFMVISAIAEECEGDISRPELGVVFRVWKTTTPSLMLRTPGLGGFLEGFLWGMRANAQGMYLATPHGVGQSVIDEAMALQRFFTGEDFGDDGDVEVAAVPGAGMTGVLVAVVDDVEFGGRKDGREAVTDECDAVGHGSAFINGFTVTVLYTPAVA